MFILFAGVILSAALFVALGFQTKFSNIPDGSGNVTRMQTGEKEWKLRPVQLLALIILVASVLVSSVTVVPTGYTGILTTFGRVENRTIGAGAHLILPWQNVVKMDNRTQKVQIKTEAFSSDIQQVDLVISVNYCIDQNTAQELYRSVGINYYENVMYPRVLENTKSVFSRYTAET